MVLYGIVFYNTMQWFMALENPNNAQAGFVSVVVSGRCKNWFRVICKWQIIKSTIIKEKRYKYRLIWHP